MVLLKGMVLLITMITKSNFSLGWASEVSLISNRLIVLFGFGFGFWSVFSD